jgi:hypothetical protein
MAGKDFSRGYKSHLKNVKFGILSLYQIISITAQVSHFECFCTETPTFLYA